MERLNINHRSTVHGGFTLLELLISLTIVGIILVIIFGSLRIGARAWEKGEADVEVQQRERVVLGLVKRQITSLCAREIRPDDEEDSYLFKGNDKSMEFMTALPAMNKTRSGIAYVKYVIKENKKNEQLALYEQDVFTMETQGIPDEPEDSDFNILIPHARHLLFEYLKKDEEDVSEWQATWDPESDEGIPLAVRMTFRRVEGEPPLRIIARIYPEVAQSISNESADEK